jgi:hypothetical protein
MKELPVNWFDHRTDLPQWIASRIAQIVVEWSVLERELEELIQMLMNTDIGFSRIMTNRMNARTRIAAALSLIEWYVFHKRVDASFLKEFEKIGARISNETQSRRDIVAHGLWSRTKGEWWVLKLRGQRSTPELKPELKKLSRAFLPQREAVTKDKLNTTIQKIVSDARAIEDFCKRIHRARSAEQFQYAPPKYTRRRRERRL